MIYKQSHTVALKNALKARGFKVERRSCLYSSCGCTGVHFSIAGNGIRLNNVYGDKLRQILSQYPVINKK